MPAPLKIIAAVDLSDFSPATIRYSLWLAQKTQAAELILINVINQQELEMVRRAMIGYDAFSFPGYLEDQIKDRKTRISDMLEAAQPFATACRTIVREGVPYYEILEVIKAETPGLLVMSTKGRSNLADVVVGSTARKLFRRCPIPLVAIPAAFNESI
jgi:nucleotide-binding universal stress UspA family protein